MSTLKADTIVAADGTSPVTLTKQVAGKFRIFHTGDGVTVNESFNASGTIENGDGDVTYSFTNNFSSGNFTTTAMSTEDGTIGYVTMYYDRTYTPVSSFVRVQGIDQTDSYEDGAFTSAVAHGDLA